MRRRLKSVGMFLIGFLLGSAASVAFAEAVRAEPDALPAFDRPLDSAPI